MTDGDGSSGDGPAETSAPTERDRLLIHSRSDQGYRVLRHRGERLELGELRNLQEGKPITGEMVSLSPTEHEQVFDVETVHPAPVRAGKGPPMVSTSTYRTGWDAIFGGRDHEEELTEVDPKLLN